MRIKKLGYQLWLILLLVLFPTCRREDPLEKLDKHAQDLLAEAEKHADKKKANLDEVRDIYQKLLTTSGTAKSQMLAHNGLGKVYQSLGNYPKSKSSYENALSVARSAGDQRQQIIALRGKGYASLASSAYFEARSTYQEALSIAERRGEQQQQATIRKDLGDVYYRLGDFEQAIKYYDDSNNGLGAKRNKGLALLELDREQEAITFIEEYLKMAKAGINDAEKCLAWDAKGYLCQKQRKYDEAQFSYQTKLQFIKDDDAIKASTLTLMSLTSLNQGKYDAAISQAEQAAKLAEGQPDWHEVPWRLNFILGEVKRKTGDYDKARQYLRASIKQIEINREQNFGGANNFLAPRIAPYRSMVALAVLQDKREEALQYAEMSKARVLDDVLTREKLESKRSAAQKNLLLQRFAPLLPDARTALLEFAVTEERTFLFVLTRETSHAPIRLEVKIIETQREQLKEIISQFRKRIENSDPLFAKQSRDIYELLFALVRTTLQKKTRLVLVKDGPLNYLPFGALRDHENKYLLETYTITETPSLTVRLELEKQRERKTSYPHEDTNRSTLIGFAVPDPGENSGLDRLPGAEKEIRQAHDIWGAARSHIYVGKQATPDTVWREVGKAQILHFAVHGKVVAHNPLSSWLLMSSSENHTIQLEVRELMQMKWPGTSLAILSACESGSGQIIDGEGVIGFTWGLIYAGCPTVISSLWAVNDESTPELMRSFYTELKKPVGTTENFAEALQNATRKMIQNGKYSHPYHWAGFIVSGM